MITVHRNTDEEVASAIIEMVRELAGVALPITRAEKTIVHNYLRSLGWQVDVVADNVYYLEKDGNDFEFSLIEESIVITYVG